MNWIRFAAGTVMSALFLLGLAPDGGAAETRPSARDMNKLSNAEAVKGVWMLAGNSGTAIDTFEDLEKLRPNLDEALSIPGVKGFSMRVTWRAIENDLSLLDAGKKLADEKGLEFSFRFLAGYRTPDSLFEAGSPYYTDEESKGQKVPTPFMPDGSPNLIFEKAYKRMFDRLVPWCKENNVRLIHCPWYGHAWAELNHHVNVRMQPGYTYDNWFDAHIRLLNIGLSYADDELAVEYPMSGGGPTGDTVSQIADYVWDKIGPNQETFFFQANGWGPGGYWGSPNMEMEMLKRRCFERPVLRGLQSIRQGDYDWEDLFKKLYAVNGTYCEIYAETLTKKNVEQMKAEIKKFADFVEANGALKPPDGKRRPDQLTMWPKISNAEAISGTWPTQQVGGHFAGETSQQQFDKLEQDTIRPALATKDVRGFSHRFPWFEIDQSMALAERGLALAKEYKIDYSIRFMAGRYTPERLYEAGCRSMIVSESGPFNDDPAEVTKVPVPFNEDGSPNLIFEKEYETYVAHLAGWCRANGVRLLHLPWYGGLWDELYHSKQMRGLKGYTYQNWLRAHLRLIDIGLTQAGRSLAIEFPFSGHGPTGDTVTQMANYVWEKVGAHDDRFIFQANGWGPQGRWGSPSPDMEALKSRAFETPIYRALQMIQPQDYDWVATYTWLYETHALYAEVYTPSFTMEHKDVLQEEITKFRKFCDQSTPRPPKASRKSPPALFEPKISDHNALLSGWLTVEAATTDTLKKILTPEVKSKMKEQKAKGVWVNAAWQLVTKTMEPVNEAMEEVRAAGKEFALGFVADSDARKLNEKELVSAWEDRVAHLAAWCRANGVQLLRVPWLNTEGEDFVERAKNLIDIAATQASPNLLIRFPYSEEHAKALADYADSRFSREYPVLVPRDSEQ